MGYLEKHGQLRIGYTTRECLSFSLRTHELPIDLPGGMGLLESLLATISCLQILRTPGLKSPPPKVNGPNLV